MRLGYTFGPFDWPSSNSYAFLRFSLLTLLYIATSSSPSTGLTLYRPVRVPKPASPDEDYNTTNNNITYYNILLLPVRNIPAGGVACNILCTRRSCSGECIVLVECLLPPFHRTLSSSSTVDRRRFYINYCYFTHHRVCVSAFAW